MPSCCNEELFDSYFSSTIYGVIEVLPIKFKLIQLIILNEMFTKGEFPPDWKTSFLHFIDKPGGKGVRPIGLISCTCKLFETMLKGKLQW